MIYEGVDAATGKERRRWYRAGTRKADAERLVTELVKRHNDGEYRPPDKTTLGAYLTERWLPAQRSQLKASTFDSYRRTIHNHVLPSLAHVALARLAPEDLDALYARLLEAGRRNASGDGPGLSPASVRYVHRVLRKALGDAVRKGTLTRNPAGLADPPKRDTSHQREREMHVWSAAQLQAFLASLDGQRLAPAFVLAATPGCAAARWPGCAGATSIWPPGSTTTVPGHCTPGGASRPRSAFSWEAPTRTTTWSSPAPTALPRTRKSSAAPSTAS